MNLWQFGLILKARWRLIGAFIAAGFVLAVLWVLLAPHIYQSTAQVLVNVRAPDTVQMQGDSGVTAQLQPDYLATQVDVIRSERVATVAVEKLGLAENPEALAAYRDAGAPATPSYFWANQLRRGLRVLPSTESRVISITFSSPDANNARNVANAFAEAYRDVSIELLADPARQASAWYETAAADLRKKLAVAQAALSKRRAELGVTAGDEQMDADEAQLGAMSQQLAGLQATQAAQSSRAGGGALPDAMLSPVVQSLQADIARLEAQRQQLSTFAGPNNVDYQQISRQLATLRAELASQKALVAQSAATSSAQSAQSVRSLQAAVEGQRQRVIALQRARGEIGALEQDVKNLKTTYEGLRAKQAQTNLLGAAGTTNVSILSPAVTPLVPSGLPWFVKTLVGLFLGTVVGTIAALIVEFLDQRMRQPEDAAIWLGIPNLGGVRSLAQGSPKLIGQSVQRYLPRSAEGNAL